MKTNIVDTIHPERDQLYYNDTAESEDPMQKPFRPGDSSIMTIAEENKMIDIMTSNSEEKTKSHHISPKIDHSFAFTNHVKDNVYLADLFTATS
jgi:hypothetical protein